MCPDSQDSKPCPGEHKNQHNQSKEVIVLLYSVLVWSHLSSVPHNLRKDVKAFESAQRREETKLVKGLESMSGNGQKVGPDHCCRSLPNENILVHSNWHGNLEENSLITIFALPILQFL